MKCNNCNNPLNEWQTECEKCGATEHRYCKCHFKITVSAKGSAMGQYDDVCSISRHYCDVEIIFKE